MKENREKETKTIVKAIFAWEDEKEEKWLEEMSLQGWQLEKAAPYIYTFKRCQPERMVYRLDFRSDFDKGYQEYQTFFKDAGWELIARFSGWHYYRIAPENNDVPEIYNSNKAKAEKYRRLLPVVLFPFLIGLNPAFRTYMMIKESGPNAFDVILSIILFLSLLLMIYAFIRLLVKIRKLESASRE